MRVSYLIIIASFYSNKLSDTWNEASVKAAWDESTPAKDRGYHVYAASKTVQEQEAWNWVKKHQPGFAFNTIVPNTNVSSSFYKAPKNMLMVSRSMAKYSYQKSPARLCCF